MSSNKVFPRLTVILYQLQRHILFFFHFLTFLELGCILSARACFGIIGSVELHKMTVLLKIDGVVDSMKQTASKLPWKEEANRKKSYKSGIIIIWGCRAQLNNTLKLNSFVFLLKQKVCHIFLLNHRKLICIHVVVFSPTLGNLEY